MLDAVLSLRADPESDELSPETTLLSARRLGRQSCIDAACINLWLDPMTKITCRRYLSRLASIAVGFSTMRRTYAIYSSITSYAVRPSSQQL